MHRARQLRTLRSAYAAHRLSNRITERRRRVLSKSISLNARNTCRELSGSKRDFLVLVVILRSAASHPLPRWTVGLVLTAVFFCPLCALVSNFVPRWSAGCNRLSRDGDRWENHGKKRKEAHFQLLPSVDELPATTVPVEFGAAPGDADPAPEHSAAVPPTCASALQPDKRAS